MLREHFGSAGAIVEYGDAGCLFSVDELDAAVLQYRDAQLALDDVDGANVIVVAPTNLATSCFLTQHALTAIPVDSLPRFRPRLPTSLTVPWIRSNSFRLASGTVTVQTIRSPNSRTPDPRWTHGIKRSQQHTTP
jgi:hypothetical protein